MLGRRSRWPRLGRASVLVLLMAAACGGGDMAVTTGPSVAAVTTTGASIPTFPPPATTSSTFSTSSSGGGTATTAATTSTLPTALCPPLPRPEFSTGFQTAYPVQLADWRDEVVDRGGGLARLTLADLVDDAGEPGVFSVAIHDVLWNAATPLDTALERVTVLGGARVEPAMLDLPLEAVSLVSNDGVAWNLAAVDDDGCFSTAAGFAVDLDLVPVTAELLTGWDHHMAWPTGSVCEERHAPPGPERHDEIVAGFLSRIGDIEAERARLRAIDRRADELSHRLGANINDIKRQLLAGVAESDLEIRPVARMHLRIPALDPDRDAASPQFVMFEGEPMVHLVWGIAQRRISVDMLLPREGNTVYAYLGTLQELPDPECPAGYAGREPYAVIPYAAFLTEDRVVDLDDWRP